MGNYNLGLYDKCIEDQSMGIELSPNEEYVHFAYFARAKAYKAMGLVEDALSDFRKAAELKPDNEEYAKVLKDLEREPAKEWVDKACEAVTAGKYDEAISCADKAIQIDPGYADAYYSRGSAYIRKLLFEKAIEDNDMAIKLNPGEPNYYFNRGLANLRLGLYDKCIKDQSTYIEMSPNGELADSAYVARAGAYIALGRVKDALSDFRKAAELKPDNQGYAEAIKELEANQNERPDRREQQSL
jgi:tetratricopeptide (TPR) repeat protein